MQGDSEWAARYDRRAKWNRRLGIAIIVGLILNVLVWWYKLCGRE